MKLFKKKQPLPETLTRTESLACIPLKSPSVTWRRLDDGALRLEYPLTTHPFWTKLASRRQHGPGNPLTRKIDLDTLGGMVWLLIDGEKAVSSIIKEFAAESGFSLGEAEISVSTFLRQLGKRGLIVLRQRAV